MSGDNMTCGHTFGRRFPAYSRVEFEDDAGVTRSGTVTASGWPVPGTGRCLVEADDGSTWNLAHCVMRQLQRVKS